MINLLVCKFIKFYQKFLSPGQGVFNLRQRRVCRFYPSCSEYCLKAFEKYGFFRALFLTIKRILKCHPWSTGGVDFP